MLLAASTLSIAGGALTLQAVAGTTNVVTLAQFDASNYAITDTAGIALGAGTGNWVLVGNTAHGPFTDVTSTITINLDDQDDTANIQFVHGGNATTVNGRAGNDTINVSSDATRPVETVTSNRPFLNHVRFSDFTPRRTMREAL